ncbi:hypothetical protein BMIN_1444 [Bifidobacterium minimum]|uniref:Uncharacterized protein n=1 Tax=Bifidobacterium minimum TaxID=1693 RepID=A0A087BLP3_9BIFI|nr:hypothetical protein BMIN_1444 [Bifidobacterium minimum]
MESIFLAGQSLEFMNEDEPRPPRSRPRENWDRTGCCLMICVRRFYLLNGFVGVFTRVMHRSEFSPLSIRSVAALCALRPVNPPKWGGLERINRSIGVFLENFGEDVAHKRTRHRRYGVSGKPLSDHVCQAANLSSDH